MHRSGALPAHRRWWRTAKVTFPLETVLDLRLLRGTLTADPDHPVGCRHRRQASASSIPAIIFPTAFSDSVSSEKPHGLLRYRIVGETPTTHVASYVLSRTEFFFRFRIAEESPTTPRSFLRALSYRSFLCLRLPEKLQTRQSFCIYPSLRPFATCLGPGEHLPQQSPPPPWPASLPPWPVPEPGPITPPSLVPENAFSEFLAWCRRRCRLHPQNPFAPTLSDYCAPGGTEELRFTHWRFGFLQVQWTSFRPGRSSKMATTCNRSSLAGIF